MNVIENTITHLKQDHDNKQKKNMFLFIGPNQSLTDGAYGRMIANNINVEHYNDHYATKATKTQKAKTEMEKVDNFIIFPTIIVV